MTYDPNVPAGRQDADIMAAEIHAARTELWDCRYGCGAVLPIDELDAHERQDHAAQ